MKTKEEASLYHKEYLKKWVKLNSEKLKIKRREYYSMKKESDPNFLKNISIRSKLSRIKNGWKPKTDWLYTKKICRICKKETTNLIKGGKKGRHDYFFCNPCNTKRLKEYRQTEIGKRNTFKAIKKTIEKYPEKQNARAKLSYAIRTGKIKKPLLCEMCNQKKKLEGHHEDYTKPLEVKFVCRQCHTML